jgi:hypothetical protein
MKELATITLGFRHMCADDAPDATARVRLIAGATAEKGFLRNQP